MGCRATVKGRGSWGPRVWTPARGLPPAVWPWPRASPGLSSEKERPCWAMEEAMPAGALSAHAAGSIQHSRGLEHSALRRPGGRLQYSGGTQGSRASVSPWVEEGVEMGPAVPSECVSSPKMDRLVTSTTESEPRGSSDGQAVPSLVSAAQRPQAGAGWTVQRAEPAAASSLAEASTWWGSAHECQLMRGPKREPEVDTDPHPQRRPLSGQLLRPPRWPLRGGNGDMKQMLCKL